MSLTSWLPEKQLVCPNLLREYLNICNARYKKTALPAFEVKTAESSQEENDAAAELDASFLSSTDIDMTNDVLEKK